MAPDLKDALKGSPSVCAGNENSLGGNAGHDPVWTSTGCYVMNVLQGTEHFVGICRWCHSVVVFPDYVRG